MRLKHCWLERGREEPPSWLSWLERRSHNPEVASSILADGKGRFITTFALLLPATSLGANLSAELHLQAQNCTSQCALSHFRPRLSSCSAFIRS